MADVSKSVEISYRADIKQLLESLKTIPGLTEKEAKSMVRGLDRQLKMASRSAQLAGSRSAAGMRQFGVSAKRAKSEVMKLRRESANLDRLTGELAAGLGELSPAAGEFASKASMIGGSLEAVFRALTLTNPWLIIAAATVAALGATYYAFSLEAKEAEKRMDEHRGAVKKTYDEYLIAAEKLRALKDEHLALQDAANLKVGMGIYDLSKTIREMQGLVSIEEEAEEATDKIRRKVTADFVASQVLKRDNILKTMEVYELQRVALVKAATEEGKTADALAAAKKKGTALRILMGTIRKTKGEVTALNKIIEKPLESSAWTELNQELTRLLGTFTSLFIAEKKGKKSGSGGGPSRAHRKYNNELRESIKLLADIGSQLTSQHSIIDGAEKSRKALIISNLQLRKKALDIQAKALFGEEKILLIQKSQSMAERIIRKQHQLKIDEIGEGLRLNNENLRLSKEAVSAAKERLNVLNKANPKYAKQKENKKAQLELAEATAKMEELQLTKFEAENRLRAQMAEQKINKELKYNEIQLKGQADIDKARQKAAKMAQTEREKEIRHMMDITDGFMKSANKIAGSQQELWARQTEKLEKRQLEAAERIDKMVETGVLTQSEGDERKAKMQDILGRKKLAAEMKIYKLNKATAIADVIFNSARAVSRMLAFPPPVGPILAAIAGAAAMAQIATIATAPAPTMHAGGMVPDERNITALKGEAVLNRAAVRNAGGPQGINRMNRGGGGDDKIIVIQPFKHFDRFVRASQRRGILAAQTRKTGSGGY